MWAQSSLVCQQKSSAFFLPEKPRNKHCLLLPKNRHHTVSAFGVTCTRCVVYFLRGQGLSLWTDGFQGPVLLRYPMGKCEFPTHVLPILFVMAVLSNKGTTKVLRLLHLIS